MQKGVEEVNASLLSFVPRQTGPTIAFCIMPVRWSSQ